MGFHFDISCKVGEVGFYLDISFKEWEGGVSL